MCYAHQVNFLTHNMPKHFIKCKGSYFFINKQTCKVFVLIQHLLNLYLQAVMCKTNVIWQLFRNFIMQSHLMTHMYKICLTR